MVMSGYVVCIPSYKRAQLCNDKTLTMLKNNHIKRDLIYVYVADNAEYEEYERVLDKSLYNKLVVGKKGLVPQRQFIMGKWKNGQQIVFFDDDVESVDLKLSPMFKGHNLDYFFKQAFRECDKQKSFIWGVYAVFNPFFRGARKELSTELNYIVGAFYGIVNRPTLKEIQLEITKENGQKEDVERTLKYFIHDGIVVRFNKIGFTTKYYGKDGGLGTFDNRLKPMLDASKRLLTKYGDYGYIKMRKNGMAEFVLRKRPTNATQKNRKSTGNTRTKRIREL
jgi:hypothetical protein